jgi:hypothetical protein
MLRARSLPVPSLLAALVLAGSAAARDRTVSPAAPAPGAPVPAIEPPASLGADTGEVAEARAEFRRGSALAKAGDWEEALAAFERSARLKPHPVTAYDVAYCQRALGRYVRASFTFEQALHASAGAAGSELPAELTRDAETYLADARNKIGRATVNLKQPDLTIRVDGRALEQMPSPDGPVYVLSEDTAPATASPLPGRFVIWLDPGAHAFAVTARGGAHALQNRTLGPGERTNLTFSFAEAPGAPLAERPSTASSPDRATGATVPDRTWAFVAFGVGAVGLVGGAVFSGLSVAEKSSLDSDPACPKKQCPPGYADRESRMLTFADLATASLVTLAAGAGTGAFLWLTGTPTKAKIARVTPWFSGTAAGVAGKF